MNSVKRLEFVVRVNPTTAPLFELLQQAWSDENDATDAKDEHVQYQNQLVQVDK